MRGWGYGSHFMAHLDAAHCSHCNNTSTRQLFAKYKSEMMMGIHSYSYDGLSIICPICEWGNSFDFTSYNKIPIIGRAKVKEQHRKLSAFLASLRPNVSIVETHNFYTRLGWIGRLRYRTMLKQIKQRDLLREIIRAAA